MKTLDNDYLKNSLIDNITKFILDFNKGFTFIGKNYNLSVSNKDYYIDLLFYNLDARAYVAIELKIGEFKPEYIGPLILYVNMINHTLKGDMDNDTIGIILCIKANRIIANTLEDTTLPLGASKYHFIKELPEYLEKRLKEKAQ